MPAVMFDSLTSLGPHGLARFHILPNFSLASLMPDVARLAKAASQRSFHVKKAPETGLLRLLELEIGVATLESLDLAFRFILGNAVALLNAPE